MFIHSLVDDWTLGLFCLWLLWTILIWASLYKSVCEHMFSVLLGLYLGVESRGHLGTLCLTLWATGKLLSRAAAALATYNSSDFTSSPTFVIFLFKNKKKNGLRHLGGWSCSFLPLYRKRILPLWKRNWGFLHLLLDTLFKVWWNCFLQWLMIPTS